MVRERSAARLPTMGTVAVREGSAASCTLIACGPAPARGQIAERHRRRAAGVKSRRVLAKIDAVRLEIEHRLGAGRERIEREQVHLVAALAVKRLIGGHSRERERRDRCRLHGRAREHPRLPIEERDHPGARGERAAEERQDPPEFRAAEGVLGDEGERTAEADLGAEARCEGVIRRGDPAGERVRAVLEARRSGRDRRRPLRPQGRRADHAEGLGKSGWRTAAGAEHRFPPGGHEGGPKGETIRKK